jgi:hypothetical protein
MIIKKRLLAIALAALMLTGCGVSHVTGPRVTTEKGAAGYPQMYDEDQLKAKGEIEAKYGVKFLGCYSDGVGCYIYWLDGPNGCESYFICEGDEQPVTMSSCGEGYELYMDTCKDMGNCI